MSGPSPRLRPDSAARTTRVGSPAVWESTMRSERGIVIGLGMARLLLQPLAPNLHLGNADREYTMWDTIGGEPTQSFEAFAIPFPPGAA